ncbi:MAG TPA: hypothetical protein VFB14_12470 [Bryobacteraceae bacterium]|nr:hypothetical protein [Bryobacteraceae bacterium]
MSSSATPKQGDHVFNAIDIALLRPFESIRSLRSVNVDGEHFLHDYLLHCYSMARKMAEAPAVLTARKFVASANAEENALREFARLRSRYPSLARITPALLREIHLRNSDQFGAAADRYEREVLTLVQRSLEAAVAPGAKPSGAAIPAVSIACQQMLNATYDPAAALVVIADSLSTESLPTQGALYSTVTGIAGTLDRPAMWRDAFASLREARPTATGRLISGIRDVLMQIDLLRAQSMTFPALIKDEIGQKSRSGQAGAVFAGMLHLVHARLQQMR